MINTGRWTPEELQTLEDMNRRGCALHHVAATLEREYKSVSHKARSMGLAFERHDKRHYNPRVFIEFTPDSAWLLGLLLSDGSFASGPRKTIGLSSTDRDLAEQMKTIMETDHPIYERDPATMKGCHGKKTQYRLYVNGADLVASLEALGIPKQKRDRSQIPAIPSELVRHFIRGYMDGDGGCSDKGGHAYCSGPFALMETVKARLETEGISVSKVTQHTQSTIVGNIFVHGKDNLAKLYHYLYDGATAYGRRKYETWQRLLEKKGVA